jgi:hypothetical protein
MPTTYAIPDGRVAMAATLYTGTGASASISNAVNGVSFQPDFVWAKGRSVAYNHYLFDSVRGALKELYSDSTSAESTGTQTLTAFNSNGFTLGTNNGTNQSAATYVGWQWKAGGAAVSNTAGSITSSVSANTTAGFSVVTYTGTGVAATVGHGLGVKPSMIIIKNRSSATDWPTWHQFLPNPTTQQMWLNAVNAAQAQGANSAFNSTQPTSSVFSVGTVLEANGSGSNFVAYCFAPVAGYSAFGSYTGNGSTDGPFIYTGFRPRFILIKGSSFGSNWFIQDSARDGYNVNNGVALRPNLANAQDGTTTYNLDILSNGFKLRSSAADSNTSGATFIYMAFAENPFKYSSAR